jgi:hypothetical protein
VEWVLLEFVALLGSLSLSLLKKRKKEEERRAKMQKQHLWEK